MNRTALKPHFIAIILFLIGGLFAHAQLAKPAAPGTKGKFYISVDDKAEIFLNGQSLHKGKIGQSESPEVELKVGDRLVVRLKNTINKWKFMMLFASNDQKRMLPFRRSTFRILPESEASDFTAAQFGTLTKPANPADEDFAKGYLLPIPSNAEWMWGETDITSLGCVITEAMFDKPKSSVPAAQPVRPLVPPAPLAPPAPIRPAPPGAKGKLFVSVDDSADVVINGIVFHHAPGGESESPELELKVGDRIIVRLKNTLGKGRFMMLFLTNDRTKMAAFRRANFKILTDPTLKDITPVEFAALKKPAKAVEGEFGKPYMLPFKSNAEWVWGDINVSSIGCIVTAEMFKPNNNR